MKISLDSKHWDIIYDGYGDVNFNNDEIYLCPKSSTSQNETHSALVLSKLYVKDFTIKIKANTVEQLRKNSVPNPWEVFWIFFNYNPTSNGKKETNYFVLKANGSELGTACGEIQQKFLATTDNPKLILENEYLYEIRKDGSEVRVLIDGNEVINFSDDKNDLYDEYGYIGLYSEDACVKISDVVIEI
jgi:hypothetical protein